MDVYVLQVVGHSLRFEWIPGMDPVNLDPMCSPRSRYRASALEDDPLLEQAISKAVRAGALEKVSREEAKCTSGILNVLKKPDKANSNGSWRPYTNLNNANVFVCTHDFRLPTLMELALSLKTGLLDLRAADFHCPVSSMDCPWLSVQHRQEVFKWQALPVGVAEVDAGNRQSATAEKNDSLMLSQ